MKEYDELLDKYSLLLQENCGLRQENERLRKRLCLDVEIETEEVVLDKKVEFNNSLVESNNENNINKFSPSEEKIAVFRTLFYGRLDVYAKRWFSLKTQKSGYMPTCGNEWDRDLCDKKKYKCSSCPNRKLLHITDEVIEKHLRGDDEYGRDVVGIYAMLEDETCKFLAVDFDEDEWEKDIVAFKNSCKEKSVDVLIERSRSGNGGHAWIFFEEKVPCYKARKLGSGLLSHAMDMRSELKFSSYDRMFPNQDTMPSGGFGNLIALPLQGKARKSDNSVFLDDSFVPHEDQWFYLSSVKKLGASQIDNIIAELCKNSDLGELLENLELSKPWESKSNESKLTINDFPCKKVNIIKSNMIHIEKAGISHLALNKIKRLGAFKNPDFYKAQAMRLSTATKPRIISTAEESSDYISLPRGAEEALIYLLDSAKVGYNIEDKTNIGKQIDVEFVGRLRDEQESAYEALIQKDIGVLSATTAFGKTVIASKIIAKRKTNTLILVHNQALLVQWKKSLQEFLSIKHELEELPKKRGRKREQSIIGELRSGRDILHGIVDIALMQSLSSGEGVKEAVREYGLIIVDECHHVSAVNFEKILKYANAKYVYGLTATPTRHDGHHPIIFLQCGKIQYKVSAKSQANQRPFDHFVIPRFTHIKTPSLHSDKNIALIYNDLISDKLRNNLIEEDVEKVLQNNRNPLILTERYEHVNVLYDMLKDKCNNVIKLAGIMGQKDKRETFERLDNIDKSEQVVIIATGKYIGEGFDYPRLDTLFLAMPIAWKGKVSQYAGRLHRLCDGKQDVRIYDYVDLAIPVLEHMYHKRVKSYHALGYKTIDYASEKLNLNIIYDNQNYVSTFSDDLLSSKKEIIIASPYLQKTKIVKLVEELSQVKINGVLVTIITRPIEEFKEKDRDKIIQSTEYLESFDIRVSYKEKFNHKFAIIDQTIVWYGSVNVLGYSNKDDNIMRLQNDEVVRELMKLL